MDPVNFIGTVADVYDTTAVVNALFDLLGADTVALHAKDCALADALVVHIDEVIPGEGTMDYELLLTRFAEDCPDGYVLIEHLTQKHVPAAQAAILEVAQRLELSLE
jgi:sugar phosphate isomerase/epimerase